MELEIAEWVHGYTSPSLIKITDKNNSTDLYTVFYIIFNCTFHITTFDTQ